MRDGLYAVDISNLKAPKVVGQNKIAGNAYIEDLSLTPNQGYVMVSLQQPVNGEGLQVFNVTADAKVPPLVSKIAIGNGVQLVLSQNGYIAALTDDQLTMTLVSFDVNNQEIMEWLIY